MWNAEFNDMLKVKVCMDDQISQSTSSQEFSFETKSFSLMFRGKAVARVALNDNPRCALLAISRDARIIYIREAMKQRRWVAGAGGNSLRCEANEVSATDAGDVRMTRGSASAHRPPLAALLALDFIVVLGKSRC
ncbi:hypothetical protein Zmor_002734 [Zophobas morio]|uniref:Uncharacterized protein n=1 Tax=Zophobas morio TaxID=2755281 RepID=A0AA38HLN1_9CUCU|nr:hypothetical protein Zmor_002734 [Zophobas morio]